MVPPAPVGDDAVETVAIVCDAGPRIGIGHVMRCIALAEELLSRGLRVVLVADVADVPWASEQVRRRGIVVRQPLPSEPVPAIVASLSPVAVVVDSYLLDAAVYAELRSRWPLLALTDGDPRGRPADLYLDQNLGAESSVWPLPSGSRHLGGLAYAQQRRDIVAHRPFAPKPASAEHRPPQVLAFFGGTDAYGVAPLVTRVLVATGVPCALTVIAANPSIEETLRSLSPAPGQMITVIGPSDSLPSLVADADVVLSASGTSAWELFCLGAAVGFVCVADNQAEAYARMSKEGLAVGVATLDELSSDVAGATARLRTLLTDAPLRARLRAAVWAKVDGRGPARVVDALLAMV
ncbi:MAG: spore coat protein [Nocardioides sp.]|nr:spore coat protein [Nocardioides sp.]